MCIGRQAGIRVYIYVCTCIVLYCIVLHCIVLYCFFGIRWNKFVGITEWTP